MALVVGRGRRAVRLVGGGHGFLSDKQLSCTATHSSPARLLGTAPVAPRGVPVPRRLWTNSQRLRTLRLRACLYFAPANIQSWLKVRVLWIRGSTADAARTRGSAGLGELEFSR